MSNQHIVLQAAVYTAQRIIAEQPKNRVFHNLHHTITVLEGAGKIGRAENLKEVELQMVLLAAVFHDLGHIECYSGHEEVSKRLANEWLTAQNYPEEKIAMILGCIGATRIPQNPKNILEEVVCDADLIHLSFESYPIYREMLRSEWEKELGLVYTDEEWIANNNKFLMEHSYFTAYGKNTLEPKKVNVSNIYS
ncbi:HD domain-containing protein [Poritiphilus flavus]|uniref:HD domain-containing protein n=1 Tax=Poritiphilus flavus TaxID=2697053 RepID=A0A6L9EE77_9FLAO|nr:HD domain-containing protein [Poritiphilus flavus]NAS13017.1 HD domain-containing protein [Poritiphilus flavus]